MYVLVIPSQNQHKVWFSMCYENKYNTLNKISKVKIKQVRGFNDVWPLLLF